MAIEQHEVEKILYQEARLLDKWELDDWLTLFTDDCRYWVPYNRDDGDPTREVSIIYDTKKQMEERVWRLQKSGAAWSAEPLAKTRRMISNVEVLDSSDGEATVSSYFVIHSLRRSREQAYAGRYEHHFQRVNGSWKIAYKKAELMKNNEYLENMSFLI